MNQVENTFWIFMDLLNVKLSKTKFLEALITHPDFPGYNSISDLLTELNIENVTIKTGVEEIKKFPYPQLVELKGKKPEYIVITEANNDTVRYLHGNKEIAEPISNYNERWNNITLVAETNNYSGEVNYKQNQKHQLLSNFRQLVIATIVVFIVLFQLITNGQLEELQLFPYIFIILTKFIGLLISILLLYKSFFSSQVNFLDKICSMGKNIKCSGVLESKGSELFGLLSWSEIGVFYFAGGFLSLLFVGNDSLLLIVLALFARASVLYVFYSIFYQLFVVKKWCTLCILIQVIFIVEAIILFECLKDFPQHISVLAIFKIALYFVLPILAWLVIKPYVLKSNEAIILKKSLLSFKRDIDVFKLKLGQQKFFSLPKEIAIPVLNRANATHRLVFISNPYCLPCAKIYDKLNKMKQYFENKLNIFVVFSVPNNTSDMRYRAAAYLAAAYIELDEKKANEIASKWYRAPLKKIEGLKKEYPVENIETRNNLINKQIEWCFENKINYTPMLILDGYLLPVEYTLDDLIFFID